MNQDQFQVDASATGNTVWVNNSYGCLARFDKRFGIDVHRNMKDAADGGSECLYCTHEAAEEREWLTFVEKVLEHHGAVVPVDTIRFLQL